MDWFLYGRGLRHERVEHIFQYIIFQINALAMSTFSDMRILFSTTIQNIIGQVLKRQHISDDVKFAQFELIAFSQKGC